MRKNNTSDGFAIILAATKCDISPKDRRVSREEAQEYSKSHGMEYMETSAKNGQGVHELFGRIAQRILEVKKQ